MRKAPTESIVIGKFGRTRGLDGWIRVQSYTDPPEKITQYQPWSIGPDQKLLCQDSHHTHDKVFVLIEGVNSIELASTLVGQEISIPRSALPSLPEGEHYWFELTGLTVINTQNKTLGICDYVTPGSQFPLIVVTRPDQPDLLVPHEPEVVKKIDIAAQTILVDWDDY